MRPGATEPAHGILALVRWVVVLVIGIVLGGWSASYVLDRPMGTGLESPAPIVVRVESATLHRELAFPATGGWDVVGTMRSPAGGLVTAVVARSGLLEAGDVAIRLNERPMVVVPGEVPAFRALRLGDKGRDVRALKAFLAGQGYEVGSGPGRFTAQTERAVRRWQKHLGLPVTGVVALGDVLFVSRQTLVAPLRWSDAIAPGAPIGPGTPILESLAAQPTLSLEFGGSPPEALEPGMAVEVTFPNGETRLATLSEILWDEGRVWATLDPAEEVLCTGDACLDLVPIAGRVPLDATFVLVPPTTGPVVPVASIRSDELGRAFVERRDGTRQLVTVRVASGGVAIVDGVAPGDEVVLP